jgi:hypothetical protein
LIGLTGGQLTESQKEKKLAELKHIMAELGIRELA